MLRVTYIGEEIAAQGFRLLGVATLAPEATHREVLDALHGARDDADLVLLDQDMANMVHAELQELLVRHPVPPVLIIPGMAEDQEFAMPALEQARRELGIGA